MRARESTHVDAPVSDVFAFMDDPHNHAAVTPRLTDVRDIERLDNGGKRLSYTYEMAGFGIDGELVQTVHEPDERMCFELRGRLTGTIELLFRPADGGTELVYAAAYDLPELASTTGVRSVVRRFNRRQLRATLRNVARRFDDADDGSATV
jgi:carbon monoxide dehydrogenase subunit G